MSRLLDATAIVKHDAEAIGDVGAIGFLGAVHQLLDLLEVGVGVEGYRLALHVKF